MPYFNNYTVYMLRPQRTTEWKENTSASDIYYMRIVHSLNYYSPIIFSNDLKIFPPGPFQIKYSEQREQQLYEYV